METLSLNSNRAALANIHHAAYRCLDAEQTRWFYEDVLGLKLAAALAFDAAHGAMLGRPGGYLHIFFEMGDGNYIAFFDEPETAEPAHFARKDSFDLHLAFEVSSMENLLAWQEHINAQGKTCLGPVDHGFVHSVYMYDPNGIQVEITCKDPRYAEIMQQEQQHARQALAEWTAQTRACKVARLGQQAVDKRAK